VSQKYDDCDRQDGKKCGGQKLSVLPHVRSLAVEGAIERAS
jgi:hypothetical protein